jgi:hypothetical protein
VWQTASGRVGLLPTANDDVYIRNVVTLTGTANITVNYFCNNLFISGTLSYTSIGGNNTINLYVNGNIRSLGVIDLRITSVSAILTLLGTDNYISSISADSTGTVTYGRNGDQDILDLPYSNLTITGTGVKKPTNNLVVSNTLNIGSFFLGLGGILDLWWWDLTVLGNTVIGVVNNTTNSIRKSYFGNILFVGDVNFTNQANQGSGCDFSVGNPNVEFRGGFRIGNSNPNAGAIRTGTGTWTFTTNNQTINANNANFPQTLDCTLIIGSGVSLTNNGAFFLNSTINGTDGTSILVQGVGISGIAPILYFNTLSSVSSMTTGIVNFTTNANTIQYNGNYSATIPSTFTTFHNLTIGGTGTKTLGANTTINANLNVGVSGFGTLELSTLNLTVTGTTTFGSGGSLLKSGAGNLLFIGAMTVGASVNTLNFSGNPTVEFRGGITIGGFMSVFNTGTNSWNFTTANQTINVTGAYIPIFSCTILIASGIVLTTLGNQATFNNIINGQIGTSSLLNRGVIYFGTQIAAENSMTVGTFDRTSFANTVGYGGNYSATIPFSTFSSLTISGTGTKTLGGNTTLNGNLLTSGIFQLSTFDLTVTGTSTTTGATGFISKNSTGNILFIGAVSLGNGSGAGGFNFSGNPNIEFRNGLTTNNNGTVVMGNGNYTFTTNNQTIFFFPGGTYIFPNATIVGAITLTWTGGGTNVSGGALSGFITNPIGTVAGSTLINNGNIFFNGLPSGVMSVGVFNITTYVNNVTYNYNGNDTLPFTTYSSLAIGGSGTKTLSGNTTINGAVAIYGSSAVFECSTYNLIVNGTFGGQTSGTIISKTGSGSLLFVGAVSTNTINWVLTGNPTIEFRNGLILSNINTSIHNTGTGQITFSTNNQNITWNNILTFNNDILISGAITVTQGSVLYGTSIIMKGILNGNNSLSKWLMGTLTNTMNYQNATQPMATGVLDTSTNLNTFIYGNGNQNIKGSPTISPKQVYRNLRFSGSGTTKTLQGFVSVLNTYTLDAGVTVNNNGYTLTNP